MRHEVINVSNGSEVTPVLAIDVESRELSSRAACKYHFDDYRHRAAYVQLARGSGNGKSRSSTEMLSTPHRDGAMVFDKGRRLTTDAILMSGHQFAYLFGSVALASLWRACLHDLKRASDYWAVKMYNSGSGEHEGAR